MLSHPAVVDSCVVGIPHQYSKFPLNQYFLLGKLELTRMQLEGGEVPRAYVVLSTAIRETIQRDSDPHALKKLEESILEVPSYSVLLFCGLLIMQLPPARCKGYNFLQTPDRWRRVCSFHRQDPKWKDSAKGTTGPSSCETRRCQGKVVMAKKREGGMNSEL